MADLDRISIRGGRLLDPANGIDALLDLHIAESQVVALGNPPAGFAPDRVLQADGQVVCPGLVDLCARVREPGQEHKATIASETFAAAASGITTLCCPPDTDPMVDTPAVAQLIYQTAQRGGQARVLPAGALTQQLEGRQITEMAALQRAGCPVMSQGDRPIANTQVQRRALEYAATFGLTVFLHPEDAWLREGGCAHEGQVAARLGLPGIPQAAETVAVARDLALAEQTGARIHFRGLSTGRATEMLAEAQGRGVAASADVSAHQLILTEADLDGFDADCRVTPPLRTLEDREALRRALATGIIGAVCSDHQPHEPDAKLAPFPAAAPGISGIETLLPLVLELVADKVLGLGTAIARLTWGPATILGLPLGRLDVGRSADVCIFDPDAPWTLTEASMVSRGHNSPFLGRPLRGRVTWTLLQGRVVFRRDRENA
jgi:dihydroorotase